MLNLASPHRIWLARAHEMAELEAALDELAGGRGSLFLITGEPGIGKTRLAHELGRAAEARGVPVHWGRAWEAGGAPAYWPFVQALRAMAADASALEAPAHTPLERFQMFAAVGASLRAAVRAPHVLVLDDLHAADPSSLQLLHFLVRDLRSLPLLVIGTYREAEARFAPDVGSLLARIAREGCVLPLRPLDRSELAQFVALATGSDPTAECVERLYAQTEGNPLFLRELLQLHAPQERLSDGILAVVRARIALLPADSRAALEAAAVLGREFAAGPLAALADISELEVRVRLEPAARAAIVEALQHPPRWRFTHVLLRQGLYDDLPPQRRAQLHAAAAAELAQRSEQPPAAELAHHLVRAVPVVPSAEAARAALRAGDHAMRLLAFEDALALYTEALELLGAAAGDELLRFDAWLGTADACMRMAEVARGREACAQAAELARRLGDGERFARAVLLSGYERDAFVRHAPFIALLEEALVRLPAGDGALRARCMAQLAADRQPEPDTGPPIALAREAVAMARRVGDREALRFALSAASLAMELYADPAERIALNRETLRLALAAGDKRIAFRAHVFLASDFLEQGDPAGGLPHVHAVEALVSEFRHTRFQWLALMPRLGQAAAKGDFEGANRALAEARGAREHDQAHGAALLAAPIAMACLTECYDDAARLESDLRAALGASPHDLGGCIGELLIAQLHGRAGDRRRAQEQLASVAAHPLFAAIAEPSWLALLTDACRLACDFELAGRLYRALLSHASRFAWLGPLTGWPDLPYARHLGLLARTLGRIDDAIAHLEEADARAERAGMRAHLARLRYELADALLERGQPADGERAAGLLAQAHALASELGQSALLPRVAELAGSTAGAVGMPAAAGADRELPWLRRDGDTWHVRWRERTIALRDSRGLGWLAQLVENAGQELHVLQLAGGAAPQEPGDAGPLIDQDAVRSYRARLAELRETRDDGEQTGDAARAEAARAEIEFLTAELARAIGLGGRERRAGDAAERARSAVTKRLREAVRRIEAEYPELGRHLQRTIRTGVFCAYLPDRARRR